MTEPIIIPTADQAKSELVATGSGEPVAPTIFVIFGGAGDLAKRKLFPALYHLYGEKHLPAPFYVLGNARRELSDDEYRAWLSEGIEKKGIEKKTWNQLLKNACYISGSSDSEETYRKLKAKIEGWKKTASQDFNVVFYMSVPPGVFPSILCGLTSSGLLTRERDRPRTRVVIEKPFGRDLSSAQELNARVKEAMTERQIYRIDHYLGKETVQNIMVFRFANSIFEPVWNRRYIDHIEITAAETVGVEERAGYYDKSGVLRDMVQNHLLQLLSLIGMEPPSSFDADIVRDEVSKVLKAIRPYNEASMRNDLVLAQYHGYREAKGVPSDSRTGTYVAMRLLIDNWRWHGVPLFLRTGKKLQKRVTEVVVHFQQVPLCAFRRPEVHEMLRPNVLTLRIQPDEGISLSFASKVPGGEVRVAPVKMDFRYSSAFGIRTPDAYETLLLDVLQGDQSLFIRRDSVEEAWRFITPIVEALEGDSSRMPVSYAPHSWGPKEADALLKEIGRAWTNPVG